MIPRWYSRLINPGLERIFRDQEGRGRPTRYIGVTTRRVCHECNTLWLGNEVENHVSKLVRSITEDDFRFDADPGDGSIRCEADRKRVFISNLDRQRMAHWAYKTMLMLDLADEEPRPTRRYFLEPVYSAFRRSGQLPSDCSMVMGWYTAKGPGLHINSVSRRAVEGQYEGVTCFTLTLAPLVFQLLRTGTPLTGARNHIHHTPSGLRRRLILLHPDLGSALSIGRADGSRIDFGSMSWAAHGFAEPGIWPPSGLYSRHYKALLGLGAEDDEWSTTLPGLTWSDPEPPS